MTFPAQVPGIWEDPSIASLAALLDAALPGAYPLALCLTGSHEAAAGLMESAVGEASQDWDSREQGVDAATWFLRIVANTFRRVARHERAGLPRSLDAVSDLLLYAQLGAGDAGVDSGEAARRFVTRFEPDQFLGAMQMLPCEFRLPAALSFAQDLTYDELGFVLSCPRGAVRSRLHRSRKLLQLAMWRISEASVTAGGGNSWFA